LEECKPPLSRDFGVLHIAIKLTYTHLDAFCMSLRLDELDRMQAALVVD